MLWAALLILFVALWVLLAVGGNSPRRPEYLAPVIDQACAVYVYRDRRTGRPRYYGTSTAPELRDRQHAGEDPRRPDAERKIWYDHVYPMEVLAWYASVEAAESVEYALIDRVGAAGELFNEKGNRGRQCLSI